MAVSYGRRMFNILRNCQTFYQNSTFLYSKQSLLQLLPILSLGPSEKNNRCTINVSPCLYLNGKYTIGQWPIVVGKLIYSFWVNSVKWAVIQHFNHIKNKINSKFNLRKCSEPPISSEWIWVLRGLTCAADHLLGANWDELHLLFCYLMIYNLPPNGLCLTYIT